MSIICDNKFCDLLSETQLHYVTWLVVLPGIAKKCVSKGEKCIRMGITIENCHLGR